MTGGVNNPTFNQNMWCPISFFRIVLKMTKLYRKFDTTKNTTGFTPQPYPCLRNNQFYSSSYIVKYLKSKLSLDAFLRCCSHVLMFHGKIYIVGYRKRV